MWSWFDDEVIDSGRLPLFLCLLAFVVTFGVTRGITRLIRTGRGPFSDNVSDSGLHVHHAVPGVVLLTVGAFMAVGADGATGWAEVAGVLVGIGTSLVLDEFALILHLDDVYWAEEGRISVEMVGLAFACLGLVMIGANPFRVEGGAGAAVLVISVVGIVLHLMLIAITVAKGKYRSALIGVFMPPVALIASVRLARPSSRWATRRYDDEKLARARTRADRFDAGFGSVIRRLSDRVAGAPQTDHPDGRDTTNPTADIRTPGQEREEVGE